MKTTDPKIKAIAKHAYPDYKGRKFYVEIWDGKPIDITSYWDGGSRTYFRFVRADGRMLVPPETAPWVQAKENREAVLVPGVALVRHTYFCGHECGITVILHPDDEIKQLEKK